MLVCLFVNVILKSLLTNSVHPVITKIVMIAMETSSLTALIAFLNLVLVCAISTTYTP